MVIVSNPPAKSHCPPFPLLLLCHFSNSADGLLVQSKQRLFSTLAQFHALNYWLVFFCFCFWKRQTVALVSHGTERSSERRAAWFFMWKCKPHSWHTPFLCTPPVCRGSLCCQIMALWDGCMYFWVGFKGQSHAQQFACVIFISEQYRASTNF